MSEADARDDDVAVSTRSAAARVTGAVREAARAAVAGLRRRPWLLAAVLAYAALLLALRPAMPFEWDEVLFQRALDEYDVSQHWPHPPGYPVYVAAARATRAVVGDPLLALQLVGIIAAVLALVLVYRLVRWLGGPPWSGAAAIALTAAVPSFAFHANVGLSDVAGAAAGLAAMAVLLAAGERTSALPWAVAVSALAIGVRPQLAPLLAPLAVVALVRVVSRREWRQLAAAAVVGLVVTDVVWLTAMYATGPGFVPALQMQARTVATVERWLRLPAARFDELAPFWLVRAFGTDALARSFWALVGAGTLAWWRAGRRRLVGLYLGSAALYVVAGMFTMNMTTAARYLLPAVPILAALAAGIFVLPGRAVRLAATCLTGVWCAAAVYWAAPAYAVRRQPAPAWAALEWVRDHLDPARTTVVHDSFIEPHARYVLGRAGFTLVEAEPTTIYPGWLRPDGSVVYVSPLPVAGGDVVFHQAWDSEPLRRLTRSRYDEAAVTRAPRVGEAVFSPEWRVRDAGWELWGTGAICLAEQAQPRLVALTAEGGQLRARRAAAPAVIVKPGERAELPLMPGLAGCVLVNGPSGERAHFPPVGTPPLRAATTRGVAPPSVVVPLVAELSEPGRAEWRSDVFLNNTGDTPLDLVTHFLPSGRDNGSAPTEAFTLPAGGRFVVKDVLAATDLRRWGRSGALMILAADGSMVCGDLPCGFTAFSRTYNARAPRVGPRIGEGLPAIPAASGLYGGGKATFGGVSNDDAVTGYVSVATWISAPVRARITLRDAEKREIAATEVDIPAFGHAFAPFPGRVTNGQLLVQLVKPPAKALFYPAVTLVNAATGEPTHLLATPSQKTAPTEWLLARPQRLPVAASAR